MRREVSLRLEAVAVEAEMAAAVRAERHRCFAGRAAATIASAWRVAKARRRLAVWVRLRAVARKRVLLPHLDGSRPVLGLLEGMWINIGLLLEWLIYLASDPAPHLAYWTVCASILTCFFDCLYI